MKKIGVLFGVEIGFPGALVERVNSMELEDVAAEFVQVGGVELGRPCGYDVIVDRVSHDVPFYRAYLKAAMLQGTRVINNPFWWSADDKFLNYALAERLGVAVPKTVLLPQKALGAALTERSVRNLQYPLDWEAVFAAVGFPAFLKPHDGGGWRDVYEVRSREEFFAAYDRTGELCMVLQSAVAYEEYYRCYVIGQEEVRVMAYDPRRPHADRYVKDGAKPTFALTKRMKRDALLLCQALGYDVNTVEFAVQDGVPYAIDFMNPVPDASRESLGEESYEWVLDRVAKLAVKKARLAGGLTGTLKEMRWSSLLGAEPVKHGLKGRVKRGQKTKTE